MVYIIIINKIKLCTPPPSAVFGAKFAFVCQHHVPHLKTELEWGSTSLSLQNLFVYYNYQRINFGSQLPKPNTCKNNYYSDPNPYSPMTKLNRS